MGRAQGADPALSSGERGPPIRPYDGGAARGWRSPMTRSPFAPHLAARGHVLLDGGLASQLELEGHDLDHALWSARLLAEDPDAIRRAHRAFLDAGADCVISASYQATPQGLRRAGASAAEARALILRSLELAEQARDEFLAERGAGPTSPAPVVAASIGPTARISPTARSADYGVGCEALVDFHRSAELSRNAPALRDRDDPEPRRGRGPPRAPPRAPRRPPG